MCNAFENDCSAVLDAGDVAAAGEHCDGVARAIGDHDLQCRDALSRSDAHALDLTGDA